MSSAEAMRVLWQPSPDFAKQTELAKYMRWLDEKLGLHFSDYQELWKWSVDAPSQFWSSVAAYFDVFPADSYTDAMSGDSMIDTHWFTGATLNYAEQVFRRSRGDEPAILHLSERTPLESVSWTELERRVGSVANALKSFGVEPGDRVAAYLPNIPEAVIAFLACASVGAVWSSCSPDFGTPSVVDRFRQIEPKVLFAVDGYSYGGKQFDRTAVIDELRRAIPSVEQTILISYLDSHGENSRVDNVILWNDLLKTPAVLQFTSLPFEHPLWILYSSGTTGLPKGIVQGQGGIVLEHMKSLAFHLNLTAGDRFCWYTTTGWMMWNFLVGGLLAGNAIVLYDGSPAYPEPDMLWKIAADAQVKFLGTSAAYIASCAKAGVKPGQKYDLTKLAGVGSTGSPLAEDGFDWVYQDLKSDVWLTSISGGTDVCSAVVGGCPLLPVIAGEIQCRMLGANVQAFDEAANSVVDQMGELVMTVPLPSMPLYFWNDPDKHRYTDSYYDVYPNVWRHGDWILIRPNGGCIIYGRSDSTINRQGIRMGTSEIYRVVEGFDEVVDSLIIDLELLGRGSGLPLFLVLRPGATLNDELISRIKTKVRKDISPRHVPDDVYVIEQVPRTLNGKKMEVPIRKLLLGGSLDKVVNLDSMSNPSSIEFFSQLAKQLNP